MKDEKCKQNQLNGKQASRSCSPNPMQQRTATFNATVAHNSIFIANLDAEHQSVRINTFLFWDLNALCIISIDVQIHRCPNS